MNDRLFYKYPSRKNPLGNRETVCGATTDMMRLDPGSLLRAKQLGACADRRRESHGSVRRWRRSFTATGPSAKKIRLSSFRWSNIRRSPKSEGAVIQQPVQNVIFNIGWHGPSIGKDNPATYAADVFSFILRQPNSRFQRNLVDTGLVTGVDLSYYTQRNVGPIALIAQTTPDKAHAVIKALYEEVAHFNDKDYYTDEQLESAKALLEADDLYSREKLSDYTHTLSFWWASTGLEYFRGYLPRLRATSRADISRYITTYIQGKPHVGLALMSNEAQAKIKLTPEELIGQ